MCQSGLQQVGELATALEPEIVTFETITGTINTPDGQAAIKAYDALAADLKNWAPGSSTGQVVEEAIVAFTDVFQTLPVPDSAKLIEGVIEAGVITILGFVQAHPAVPPTPPAGSTIAPGDALAAHQAHVVAETTARIQVLVPGFKLSKFHTAKHQLASEMSKAVAAAGPKYASLKMA
jgi:hypothetical protein